MTYLTNQWDNSTTELDFEKHWSSINVQEEVLRGVELRQRKPKTNDKDKYDFVKVSLPSCSKSSGRTSPRKRKTQKVIKMTKMLKQNRKDRPCPLRVVELAEPSKRHCLNTWKNNYQTLPAYIVDRLRRHVMDETPVVRISDAVNYFKNKKSSKKSTRKFNKSSSKIPRRDLNMRASLLFAHKIAQKLSTPIHIILNDELENINHVVTDEINNILRPKKKSGINIYKNDKILKEMTKKVTIWIANILEETSYKQLLEQLQEMEEEEGPVLDILDQLLESVMVICKAASSSDSMHSINTSDRSESLSTEKADDGNGSVFDVFGSEEDKNLKASNYEEVEKILDKDDLYSMKEETRIKEYFKSLIEEKINEVVDNDSIKDNNNLIVTEEKPDLFSDTKKNIDSLDLKQTTLNEKEIANSKNHDYIGTEIVLEPDKTIDSTLNSSQSPLLEDIHQIDDLKLNSNEVAIEESNQISTADSEEETKKVKFSNTHIDYEENGRRINKHSSEFTYDYKEPVVSKSSKDYILSHFTVAPPNPNLLSYIDEVWPEYILPPLLKATESVSKSVTSLGRIVEADENIIETSSQKLPKKNREKVLNKQLLTNGFDEGLSVTNNENKYVEKSVDHVYKQKEFVKVSQLNDQSSLEQLPMHFTTEENVKTNKIFTTSNSNDNVTNDRQPKHDSPISVDKHFDTDVEIPKIFQSQNKEYTWKKQIPQEYGVVTTKSNLSLQTDLQDKPSMKESIKHTLKISSKTPENKMYATVNKKVQTSFVTNFTKDDFCFKSDEHIRQWCMGLQNVIENLELWTTWIQNVCLNTIYLKQKEVMLKCSALKYTHIKNWIILNENINADIRQWSRLRMKLHRGLQTFKSSYHISRKATPIQAINHRCKCSRSYQKNPLCSQIVFENFYRPNRRV